MSQEKPLDLEKYDVPYVAVTVSAAQDVVQGHLQRWGGHFRLVKIIPIVTTHRIKEEGAMTIEDELVSSVMIIMERRDVKEAKA